MQNRELAMGALAVSVAAIVLVSCLMSIDPLLEPKSDASADGAAGAAGAAGGGGVGGSSGTDAGSEGGGCEPVSTPLGETPYSIRALSNPAIVIDGECAEPAWQNAESVAFTGQVQTSQAPTLRLLWDPATDKVFGCVVAADDNLIALAGANDDPKIFQDDRIEYYLHGDSVAALGENTVKYYINAAGNTYDSNYPDGAPDKLYVAVLQIKAQVVGTLNQDGGADQQWSAEWESRVPFDIAAGQLSRCEFMRMSVPEGAIDVAFGTLINQLSTWGFCRFECPNVSR